MYNRRSLQVCGINSMHLRVCDLVPCSARCPWSCPTMRYNSLDACYSPLDLLRATWRTVCFMLGCVCLSRIGDVSWHFLLSTTVHKAERGLRAVCGRLTGVGKAGVL